MIKKPIVASLRLTHLFVHPIGGAAIPPSASPPVADCRRLLSTGANRQRPAKHCQQSISICLRCALDYLFNKEQQLIQIQYTTAQYNHFLIKPKGPAATCIHVLGLELQALMEKYIQMLPRGKDSLY